MWGFASSVQLQDKATSRRASIVPLLADPTKNWLVIVNPDGSSLWSGANSFWITLDWQWGVISTWIKGDWVAPCACTLTGWTILWDVSGSITIDTRKDTYANFPPTVADTMRGTKPNITTATKNTATGLSIAITAWDIIRFNVDSCTSITRCNLTFNITK